MYRALVAAILLTASIAAAEDLRIVPTTTLQAETANNTSAANDFQAQSNGNSSSANVSKLDIRSLLYPGATTRIYAHLMPWFGDKRHMRVGYNSQNPAQVRRQIEDMVSRGINGVVIDWYGPEDFTNVTALAVMAEAERHPGFTFAIMVDKGALRLSRCRFCDPQQTLTYLVHYIEQTFVPSPAYTRINGHPLITDFEIDLHYAIDWDAISASTWTDAAFIFQNPSGFTHARSHGGYAWVRASDPSYGMNYLGKFYRQASTAAGEFALGGVYKGFNDTLASWGLNRVMPQRCGQTWLDTFDKINSFYDAGHPLDAIQLVTWNDYEEGTELETGIDNCVNLSAQVDGTSLQWRVSGKENTIDHYQVFISGNGADLMPLNVMAPGSRTLDLSSYSLTAGNYIFYVQAVGKPGLRNQMSDAVHYTVNLVETDPPKEPLPIPDPPPPPSANPPASQPPAFAPVSLSASPRSITVINGRSGASQITLAPGSFPPNRAITLSCSGLPQAASCIFSAADFDPHRRLYRSNLTISTTQTVASTPGWAGFHLALQYALFTPGFALAGLGLNRKRQNSRRQRLVTLSVILVFLVLACLGCGGNPVASGSRSRVADTPRGIFTISIQGGYGGQQASIPITLTVQ